MSAFSHKLGQVTYPRMERQDLTQSQLGSFKFTPTDDVRHVFSHPSPQLTQQSMYLTGRNTQTHKLLPRISATLPNNNYPNHYSPKSATSPTRFDSAFFDTYIKPDLAKSRLVLGPNALRAAVDGSPTSPQRHSISMNPDSTGCANDSDFMQFNMAPRATDHTYPVPSHDSASQYAGSNPTPAQDNINLLHTSLIRALATEQQAHQLTKDALEVEKNARLRAEAEVQRCHDQNRSLIGSINMLKSVIQHNVKKEKHAAEKAEYDHFHVGVKAGNQPRTILHDAVEKMREEVAARSALAKNVDNNLFDFDLLERHGSPSLRRHFSGSRTEIAQASPAVQQKSDQLINVTPEKAVPQKKSHKINIVNKTVRSQPSKMTTMEDEPVVLKNKPNNKVEKKSDIAEKVMTMPFDAQVQWNNSPVFEDEQDKSSRLGYGKSIFAAYPVRYVPDKSDKNLYRTVMIDFIPKNTGHKAILDQIRGGTVESIQLVGPIGRSTNFMTARIVFTYELGARGVYQRGQNPGITVEGKRVRVWQVLEPTYPRDQDLEHQIFEEGFTRFLLIQDAAKQSLKKLPQKLERQIQAGSVIEIGQAHDGLPMVEFTSIAECSNALKQLLSDPDFSGSQFDFEEDPCNDPY